MDKMFRIENGRVPATGSGRLETEGGDPSCRARNGEGGYVTYMAGHYAQLSGFRGDKSSLSLVHLLGESPNDMRHLGGAQYFWRKVSLSVPHI
jgi:hypothetical protein